MNHLQGFGLLLLAGGVVAAWGGAERVLRRRALVRRAVAVAARIVEVESDGGVEPGEVTRYHPVVTFTADGKTVRARLLRGTGRGDEYRAGGNVRVYYDPLDPTRVVRRPRDYPGGGVATVLGVVFTLIGAGLLCAGWGG